MISKRRLAPWAGLVCRHRLPLRERHGAAGDGTRDEVAGFSGEVAGRRVCCLDAVEARGVAGLLAFLDAHGIADAEVGTDPASCALTDGSSAYALTRPAGCLPKRGGLSRLRKRAT
jgi:hypothetical protein